MKFSDSFVVKKCFWRNGNFILCWKREEEFYRLLFFLTFYEKEVSMHTHSVPPFFFLSVYITEASHKSNLTVWGEWCNVSFTKEVLWVQAVEVFEWDCGCLTSAGFYRYRCRRCCWFFCSQGHFTKRSKAYKKKVEEKKGWIGFVFVIPVYLNLVRIS